MPRRYYAIYPLFMMSGFCGLIYESIWAQYLKLFLGHAAYAQTVVLVVFIGGMAIGAALCGRFASRFRNPLVLYAGAEFIVGWCAIAFHRIFVSGTDWAYDVLLPATCSAEGLCVSSWVFATLLILPQSILLGTTFPLMAAGALRIFRSDPGRRIALLYFLNSFGAVFGVLASTFMLIPAIGLPGASMVAGILNVLLAVAIYGIADPKKRGSPAPLTADRVEATNATPRLLLVVALLTGLSSFVYEIVWIRMLSLVLGASTHAFELMLASFILGLALGGAWIRTRIDRLRDAGGFLAAVQIIMGVLALLTLPLYHVTFDAMSWLLQSLARTDSGYLLFNVGSSLIASAVMLPVTFMAGMTLPLITLLLFRNGAGEASLGKVYASNTVGAILGTIAAVHFGLPLLGLKGSLIAGAAVDIGLGVWLFLRASQAKPSAAWGWSFTALAVLAVAPFATQIDPNRKASGVFRNSASTLPRGQTVLFDHDGKTATISVVKGGGHVAIKTNGKPDAAIKMSSDDGPPSPDEYTMVMAAMLPMMYKPDIQRAAIIGFGSGLSTSTVLASPTVSRVDSIEIEPAIVEGARAFLPRVDRAFNDPRSRIVVDDAKSYFARTREKYDLILSEPSNPWVSGTASLFTEEFYRRVKRSLNTDGVFVQWVQYYEFDSRLVASIVNAMEPVFEDYIVYNTGGDLLFVARANGKLPQPSRKLFDFPLIAEEGRRLGLTTLSDINLYRFAGRALLRNALFFEAAPANSDYEPFVDVNAPRARFKNSHAEIITEVKTEILPVAEYFDRPSFADEPLTRPPHRSPDTAFRAFQTVRFLDESLQGIRSAPTSDKTLLPGASVGAFQTVLIECASHTTVQGLWPSVIELSSNVNITLSPTVLEPFWARAAKSQCLSSMPPRYRDWIALFRAIGNRDAESTARFAVSLLDAGAAPEEIEYLFTAALTGMLGRGQLTDARALVARWLSQLPKDRQAQPAFRLLRRVTGIDIDRSKGGDAIPYPAVGSGDALSAASTRPSAVATRAAAQR